MTSKTFKIEWREFGRGPANLESFSTLAEARNHIRDRWQGSDYIDSDLSFHTDYCTYDLIGWNLHDVGKRVWYEDWFEWEWLPLEGDPAPETFDDDPDEGFEHVEDRRPETDGEPHRFFSYPSPPEPRRPDPDGIPF